MRTSPRMPTETILDPYIGLRPYTDSDDDRARFFGREKDEQIIIANLYAARLTVLYGASGVGKSSVLLAGVVPKLRETSRFACVVFRTWQLENVLLSLKTAILNAVQNAAKQAVEVDLAMSLDDFLLECTRVMRGHVVLIFDQFEEYFVYHNAPEVREGFEAQFARSVNRSEIDASFLLSMREDWLSKLDRFQGRIPKLLNNLLRLDHLDRDATIRAIREPLAACSKRLPSGEPLASIEDDLVKALLDQLIKRGSVTLDSAGQRFEAVTSATPVNNEMWIETPDLQVVLTRLWDEEKKHGSRRLRLATLKKLGGASKIFSDHLDKTMHKLTWRDRRIAVDIFGLLVTSSGTKFAHTVADLAGYSHRRESRLAPLLQRLADSNIGILRRIPPPLGEPDCVRYEIFHDALADPILNWRRRKLRWRLVWRVSRWAPVWLMALAIIASIIYAVWESFREGPVRSGLFGHRSERDLVPHFQAEIPAGVYQVSCSPDGKRVATVSSDGTAVWRIDFPTWRYGFEFELLEHAQGIKAIFSFFSPKGVQGIKAVFFSPKGDLLATIGGDNVVRLWNAKNGAFQRELKGHTRPVTTIDFSHDEHLVVTASLDFTARIWETDTGQLLHKLEGHTNSVKSGFLSPNSDRVITASKDGTARIWNAATGKCLAELTGHTTPIFKAMFSPDGNLALTVSHRTVRVWDAATGTKTATLSGHKDVVTDGVISPNSQFVATASADGTGRIWDARSGESIAELRGHTGYISCVRFSSDGTRLVTASDDNTARVWDAASGKVEAVLQGHTGDVTSAEFTSDGKFVVTASRSGNVRIWALPNPRSIFALTHDSEIYGAKWSSDGQLIVTASNDGSAHVWDSNGKLISELVGHNCEVINAEFSPDNSSIVTASRDNSAALWDTRTGHQIALLAGHADRISSASFSPDSNFLVTTSWDHTAQLWNRKGEKLHTLRHHTDVECAAFSPDSEVVVTGCEDGAVKAWHTKTGEPFLDLPRHAGGVVAVAFSPVDNQRLLTVSDDGTAFVLRLAEEVEPKQLVGHTGGLTNATFSHDGSMVVTASRDCTARVWETETGKQIGQPLKHGDTVSVSNAAFSLDSTLVVTASGDGSARVWEARSGKQLAELREHTGDVNSAAFSPDGQFILTAGRDHTARIWKVGDW